MGYICIHGHFYQPPRENPWLEAVELQDSAYPYHDWNERVTAECYEPNSAARILNAENRIVRIVNNYERISFNFGPTLLSWMETKAPRVYRAVMQADRASKERFSGHGSAIAQAYHHVIMPLANRRDKHTQVAWGIRDFEYRFGRLPEGMWLPETAVDLETLDILAEFGIKFTILSPRQARRESKIGGRIWKEVSDERIDPSMPYQVNLPSGRSISVFFYDGPISRAVAFEDLLAQGERFASRLMAGFAEDVRAWPELVHVAADGETYGHHHTFGEMGLAAALDHIETNQLAQLTNYGEYLEKHPPIHRAEIFENSSWSCVHGIERWRSNCGCNSGGHAGWNQEWRLPLREALDWLRDTLLPKYEESAGELLKDDPWAVRNRYIDVILDRSHESVETFFKKHAVRELDKQERVRMLRLLELQRHAMLMYTSCGWFFDELSGVETVQVMSYAARAIELAQQLFGDSLEASFLERLTKAKSNLPEHGDGARIYQTLVKPSTVDLLKVGKHYAVSEVFEVHEDRTQVYCYDIERRQHAVHQSGDERLVLGKAVVKSRITEERSTLEYGVLHSGGQKVAAGARVSPNGERDPAEMKELVQTFSQPDKPDLRSQLKQVFGEIHSIDALFKDQRRMTLTVLSNSVMAEVDATHRQIYERHAEFMRVFKEAGMPLPKSFWASAQCALNSLFRDAFALEEPEPDRIGRLLKEAKILGVEPDTATLAFGLGKRIETVAEFVAANVTDIPAIARLNKMVSLARSLPFPVDLWWVQTLCREWMADAYDGFLAKAQAGDHKAELWMAQVAELADHLLFAHPGTRSEPLRASASAT
jgi:alpha-amylase/alpha-mannosidase (GH57 family)